MACGLALGQVERVAERTDQLGQRDAGHSSLAEDFVAHQARYQNALNKLPYVPFFHWRVAQSRIAPPLGRAYLVRNDIHEDRR